MSAEKFRVVIYTNTCEKKVSYISATEDINIAIMPFQTADNGLIIVDWLPESPDNQYHLNK